MAWITEKRNGFLVRWRDGGRGSPTRSRFFHDRKEADALKAKLDGQAQSRRILRDVPGIPGWGDDLRPTGAVDPAYAFENYLVTLIRGNRDLRETTREVYLRDARNHIEGTPLGRADIRAISPEMLTSYWSGLEVGNGALRSIAKLLSLGFRRAVRTSLIDVNPLERAPDVRKPTARVRREERPLTVAEIERLADAATLPRNQVETLVLAYGGLRAGEVGGLRVEDVDFERDRLHVRQQVVRVNGRLQVTDLKTDAARRIVTLPRSVIEELRAFIDANPPADDGRIFHGPGGSLRDASAINHSLQAAAKRAGINTHAHGLRHTAVSLWIADGASPVDVQHMAGHTDIGTTLGLYAHLFDYGGAELAASMERRREAHRNGGA